jgi:hypothetical protein
MNLTSNSYKLLDFFQKHNCLSYTSQTKNTEIIMKDIYYEIKESFQYINGLKKKYGSPFIKTTIQSIKNIEQIKKPTIFPANSFPQKIRKQIDENIYTELMFYTHLFNRNITIYFLLEDTSPDFQIYEEYAERMLAWLYIIDSYASKHCANQLTIYVYHTSMNKKLPNTNLEVLGEENVNTAFTSTCPKNSEIVVFRKEEWFKVFMHETFHNFGLDFSDMNNEICNQQILNIFPVRLTDINLYESYTEFWARIMNVLFYVFINMKNKNDFDSFLKTTQLCINIECMFSYFQMIKVLDFMGLNYVHLIDKNEATDNIRKTLYKEKTSVLSYYIITLILMINYQNFLGWCSKNNTSLLQFKKTTSNQNKFCKFIEQHYDSKNLLKGIECNQILLNKMKNTHKYKSKRSSKLNDYILNNLRMTIFEME